MAPADDLDFGGKVAIVTGGSRGIGAGVSESLVRAGADVMILARSESESAATAHRINAIGPGTCTHLAGGVAHFGFLRTAIDTVAMRSGRLDLLVNNAAYFPGWQPIDEISEEALLRALRTNVGAYVVGSQAALPHLRRSGGSIINIGSISGEIGGWHDAVYSATKGAILSFTKALAVEEATNSVRVNAILPGNIVTEARIRSEQDSGRPEEYRDKLDAWQWMARSGTVEEVGKAVLFLASPMASFCTGISLIVSGGLEIGYGPKRPYPDLQPIKD